MQSNELKRPMSTPLRNVVNKCGRTVMSWLWNRSRLQNGSGRKVSLFVFLGLSVLLSSCATSSPELPRKPVLRATTPALPAEARQEALPSWCSPTCTEAQTQKRLNSAKRLTELMPEGGPVKPLTTP